MRLCATLSVVLGLAACGEEPGLSPVSSRLVLPDVLVFPTTVVGTETTEQVELIVSGDRPVRLLRAEAPAGFVLGELPEAIRAGDSFSWSISFVPQRAGGKEGRLWLVSDADNEIAELRLEASSVDSGLEFVPQTLDLGAVMLGDSQVVTANLWNRLSEPVAVSFDASVPFEWDAPSSIPGFSSINVDIRFAPTSLGEVRGRVRAAHCSGVVCQEDLQVVGEGVLSPLRCEERLDFGYVDPRVPEIRQLNCQNQGSRRLFVDGLEFSNEGFDSRSFPSSFAPFESSDIEIQVSSSELGPRQAVLTIRLRPDAGRPSQVQVELAAQVERAELELNPPTVDFGMVAVGVEATAEVQLRNAGTRSLVVGEVGSAILRASNWQDFGQALELQPGEAAVVELALTATRAGEVADQFPWPVEDLPLSLQPELRVLAQAAVYEDCQLSFEPELDFGLSEPGEASYRLLRVRNNGAGACLMREAEAAPPFYVELAPSIVPAQAKLSLPVSFQPTQAGNYVETLGFVGSIEPSVQSVLLRGRAVDTTWTVQPKVLDFGPVKLGCTSSPKMLRVRNRGSLPVAISELAVSSPRFELVSPPLGFPAPPGAGGVLPAGQSYDFRLVYRPDTAGLSPVATLDVESSLGLHQQSALYGRGVSERAVDRFVQSVASQLDLLLVLDNSPSMDEELQALRNSAATLVEALDQLGVEYQLAVVTTDALATRCGALAPEPTAGLPEGACGYFMGSAGARLYKPFQPIQRFLDLLEVPPNGAAQEAGLEATQRALALAQLGGHNLGFLRPSAHLSVLLFSDEEDNSEQPLEVYVSAFEERKAPPGVRSSFSSVAATAPCVDQRGLRYQSVARNLEGLVRSICEPAWQPLLRDLAARSAGLRTRFLLTGQPVPSSIEVSLDGQPQSGGWRFEAGAVVFDARPPAGSRIAVSYEPACL